jgi:lipoyl(octanoyl) transferase
MEGRPPILAVDLGIAEYGRAWELQKRLHAMRVRQEIGDVLLLLEHPPTLTVGKSGSMKNVLASPERLAQLGISLFFIERGGDVTYHGPGQVVGYPIMDLRGRGKDIYGFVTDLEEVMIRTARDFHVEATRDPGHRGVWVNEGELGAIGLSVRRWVSMHGFAFNVTTNLEHFTVINPCGFSDRQATSLAALLGLDIAIETVRERLQLHFSAVFNVDVIRTTEEQLGRVLDGRPT